MDLTAEAKYLHEQDFTYRAAKQTVEREEKALEEAKATLKHAQHAQEILQLVSQAVQQKAHERISKVVSTCLAAVFEEDPYEFHIDFERKRGKTEARLVFTRDGHQISPTEASGGGVVDIASFALRVACLVMHRPRLLPLVVLDEPFKFVSKDYRPNVRKMLEQLAQEMKIQIVMVTHDEELSTGKIIHI